MENLMSAIMIAIKLIMTWSYNLIFNNLKNKGMLISDDINDNEVFIDFVKKINKKYTLLRV